MTTSDYTNITIGSMRGVGKSMMMPAYTTADILAAFNKGNRGDRSDGTFRDWLGGDIEAYLPDLWGRAGLLEREDLREENKRPVIEDRPVVSASGLGDRVTLNCSCGWGLNVVRDEAEAASSKHYTWHRQANRSHSVQRVAHDETRMMSDLECDCAWRERVRDEQVGKVTIDHLQQSGMPVQYAIHIQQSSNGFYRVTCTCGMNHTSYALSDAENWANQHGLTH